MPAAASCRHGDRADTSTLYSTEFQRCSSIEFHGNDNNVNGGMRDERDEIRAEHHADHAMMHD